MSALRNILVVDDDPVVGKSFSRVLSGKGYAVITAANAQEALAKMQDSKYDLIYTDIKMPGMDGLELAERVKAAQPWTPVVIVTGYGTTAQEQRAKAAGVSAFLHKPLSPEMIEGSAADALLAPAAVAVAVPAAAPVVAAAVAPVEEDSALKKIALLVAAPFIGLAYFLFLLFIGLGMLATMAVKGLLKLPVMREPVAFVKNVGLFLAAPFIGLAYVLLFPFIGMAILARTGWAAARKERRGTIVD
ncbi:MAG: response regulator [Betaproteobacteria bacterium]|nr:response regulator [Betaproteobacteria bacterium]